MTDKRRTPAGVIEDVRAERDAMYEEWENATRAAGLTSVEMRLELLEAEVALYRHRLAEEYGMSDEGCEDDWTRATSTVYAVADNQRAALEYALARLVDGVPLNDHMDEWARMGGVPGEATTHNEKGTS